MWALAQRWPGASTPQVLTGYLEERRTNHKQPIEREGETHTCIEYFVYIYIYIYIYIHMYSCVHTYIHTYMPAKRARKRARERERERLGVQDRPRSWLRGSPEVQFTGSGFRGLGFRV